MWGWCTSQRYEEYYYLSPEPLVPFTKYSSSNCTSKVEPKNLFVYYVHVFRRKYFKENSEVFCYVFLHTNKYLPFHWNIQFFTHFQRRMLLCNIYNFELNCNSLKRKKSIAVTTSHSTKWSSEYNVSTARGLFTYFSFKYRAVMYNLVTYKRNPWCLIMYM